MGRPPYVTAALQRAGVLDVSSCPLGQHVGTASVPIGSPSVMIAMCPTALSPRIGSPLVREPHRWVLFAAPISNGRMITRVLQFGNRSGPTLGSFTKKLSPVGESVVGPL